MRASAGGFELHGPSTPIGTLLRELWASRDLISILARKDFYVRYRRASLGMAWAVGLPLVQAVVLSLVFSQLAGRAVPGGSYAAYVFSGLVGWSYFSVVLGTASTAIVDGKALSSRIYFPRAVLPLATVVANLYSFVPMVVVMLALTIGLGVGLGPEAVLLLPAIVLLVVFSTSLGLVLSALHVYFRDIRFVVAALLTPWFYLTPIIYPIDLAPDRVHWLIRANPATGFVELFRAATVGANSGWVSSVVVTSISAVVLTALALRLHGRHDRVFADLL